MGVILKDLLGELGVTVFEHRAPEEADFEQWLFRDTPGFKVDGWLSLYHNGEAGLSFLLPEKDDALDVRRLADALPPAVSGGTFELADDEHGTVLRLVHRFPASLIDAHTDRFKRLFALARETASAIAIRGEEPALGERARAHLVERLISAGLAIPPMPSNTDRLCKLGPWWWGSMVVPSWLMYMFEAEVFIQWWDRRPAFVLCHEGHGVNSYGLNLFYANGPVACFVQHGWGGAYADPHQDVGRIARGYSRIRSLPTHPDDGFDHQSRYLLLYSEFRAVGVIVDLEQPESSVVDLSNQSIPPNDHEARLFEAADNLVQAMDL